MGVYRFDYDALDRPADAAWLLRERLYHKSLHGPAQRFRDQLNRLAKPRAWLLPHVQGVLDWVLLDRVDQPRRALWHLFRNRLKPRAPT